MESIITREAAWELLRKYNKDPFHLQHALTVEGVMRWYAEQLGYANEVDFWGMVGLLHDIDFELYPEEHCIKAPELLRERRNDPCHLQPRLRHNRRCEARAPDGKSTLRY